jgi:hypothetical protein
MPYFIYKVLPLGILEKIARYDAFRDASVEAKKLRASPDLPAHCKIRIIFAENELHAEDLLSQVREPERGVIGDD